MYLTTVTLLDSLEAGREDDSFKSKLLRGRDGKDLRRPRPKILFRVLNGGVGDPVTLSQPSFRDVEKELYSLPVARPRDRGFRCIGGSE